MSLAEPARRAPERRRERWTDPEVRQALRLLREDPGLERVAASLGRTPNGVRLALKKRGLKPLAAATAGCLRLQDLVRVMGLSGDHHTARRWLSARLLKARRTQELGRGVGDWLIYPGDLVDFLGAHPEAYDYDRIPARLDGKPNPWKGHARRVDPRCGYLTPKQAAAKIGIHIGTCRAWCASGRLPAVRLTGPGIETQEWWLRREDVEAFRQGYTPRPKEPLYVRLGAALAANGGSYLWPINLKWRRRYARRFGTSLDVISQALTRLRREAGVDLLYWNRRAGGPDDMEGESK